MDLDIQENKTKIMIDFQKVRNALSLGLYDDIFLEAIISHGINTNNSGVLVFIIEKQYRNLTLEGIEEN